MDNVTVLTNVETKAIHGTDKVESLDYVERDTQKEVNLELSGVFILIGLVPNTEWLEGVVERNSRGEIIVDSKGLLMYLVYLLQGIVQIQLINKL